MITECRITAIVEAFIVKMAFKITVLTLKRKKALYRLNVCKGQVCRGDNTAFNTTYNSTFYIFEQQNTASLFDKADRECKRLAFSQVVFYFIEKCYLGVVG